MKTKVLMGIALISLLINGFVVGFNALGIIAIVSSVLANILLWSDHNE